MNQVEVSTTLTLVRFLSVNLSEHLNPLDTCIVAIMILLVSFVLRHEYILSALSRRLAVLLILEKIRPLLTSHIDNGEIFKVHGLFINAGFLSMVALIPPTLQSNPEVALLMQSFLYLYSNIFDFFSREQSMRITVLALSLLVKVYLSRYHAEKNSIAKTVINITDIAATYLCLAILQKSLHVDVTTQILQMLLYFLMFQFLHNPNLNDVQDFLVYNFASILLSTITTDKWYWAAILLCMYQVTCAWLTVRSPFVQVLLIMMTNLVVGNVLTYIKNLAVYDTIITLKTSAIVLQFVVHEITHKITIAKQM